MIEREKSSQLSKSAERKGSREMLPALRLEKDQRSLISSRLISVILLISEAWVVVMGDSDFLSVVLGRRVV